MRSKIKINKSKNQRRRRQLNRKFKVKKRQELFLTICDNETHSPFGYCKRYRGYVTAAIANAHSCTKKLEGAGCPNLELIEKESHHNSCFACKWCKSETQMSHNRLKFYNEKADSMVCTNADCVLYGTMRESHMGCKRWEERNDELEATLEANYE